MQVTTYGYRKPDSGDKSKGTNGWMASYDFNVTRFDAHNHDGVNSTLLTISSFAATTQTLAAGDWVTAAPLSGYKQSVTVPITVVDLANFIMRFNVASGTATGEVLYLNWDKTSATTYDVYCNDNSISVLVTYR